MSRKEKKEKRLSRLTGWFRRLSTDKLPSPHEKHHVRASNSVSSMPVPHTVTGVVNDNRRHSSNEFGSHSAASQSMPNKVGYRKSMLSNGFTLGSSKPPTPTDNGGAGQRCPANSEATHETTSSDRTLAATPSASLLTGEAINGLALAVTSPPSTASTPAPSIAASSAPSLHRGPPSDRQLSSVPPASRLPLPVAPYARSASTAPSRSSRDSLSGRDAHREALRQSLRLRVADPTRPVVDYQRAPGVIITLLAVLDKKTLLAFRLTCRRHAALVNELYSAHVVIKGGAGGYHAISALGRSPVCYNGRPYGRGRPFLQVVGRVGVLSFEGGLRTWDLSERAEADAAEERLRHRLPRVANAPVVRVADLAFAFENDVNPSTFVWFQTEGHRETYVPLSTRRLVVNLWGNWRFPILNYPDLELEEVIVHPSPWIRKEDWTFRAECVAVIARTLLLDLVADQPPAVPEVRVSNEDDESGTSGTNSTPDTDGFPPDSESESEGKARATTPTPRSSDDSIPSPPQPTTPSSPPRKHRDIRVTVVGFDPIDETRHASLPGYKRYSLPLVRDQKIGEWKRFTNAHEALGDLMSVLSRITFVTESEYRESVGERRWILETERDAATCAARMRLAKT